MSVNQVRQHGNVAQAKVDWTKPIQTYDGKPARLICSDRSGGELTRVVLVTGLDGIERCTCVDEGGCTYTCGSFIRNVPEKMVGYLNLYPDELSLLTKFPAMHPSRQAADAAATPTRIACVRVEYTEGQFDE